MAKKGMSGDMVLQIGLLAIAAFTTLMAVNLFYDSVEVSVFGDPYLAVRTMSSYTDFIDSSPMPMKIYHEIPQDFMGNPGYGSVLYNPETCEFRVNKYPQDYMSNVILNHAWDTITLEEGLAFWGLSKFNKGLKKGSYKLTSKVARKFGEENIEAVFDRKAQIIEGELIEDSIKKQGYDVDELMKNARAVELDDAFKELGIEQSAATKNYVKEADLLQETFDKDVKQANKAYVSQLDEVSALGGAELSSKMVDDFPYTYNSGAQRWQWKAGAEGGIGGQFVSKELAEYEGKTVLKNNAFISNQNTLIDLTNGFAGEYDTLAKSQGEALGLADDKFEKALLNKQFRKGSLEEAGGASKSKNIKAALTKIGVDPKEVKKLDKVAKDKLTKQGFLSRSKTKVMAKGATLVKVPYHIIKFPFSQIKKNHAIYKKAFTKLASRKATEEITEKAGKELVEGIVRNNGVNMFVGTINKGCRVQPFPANAACFLVTYGISVVSYLLEYYLTYLPIVHFIERSQDATEAIDGQWASASCISEPEKILITKPNCGSESYLDYPELGGTVLGKIPFVEEITEALFAMPSSQPKNEIKEYNNSEIKGEVCVDYHNYLLSSDVESEGWNKLGNKYINPREVVATVPFLSCAAASFAGAWIGKSEWGPGCTTAYGILYLSNWIDPQMSATSKVELTVIMAYLSGPAAIPLTAAFLSNPLDSKTFFPYISKSAGMVDTDKYYYIENPYMISISKDYKDGEYVTEINKEL